MPVSAGDRNASILIVAAGSGIRLGGVPKQYRPLAGSSLLRRSVIAFRNALPNAEIRVVIDLEHRAHYETACSDLALPAPVGGGATRQESVRLGLEAWSASPPRYLLVHDAARPFVSTGVIARVCEALREHPAVLPAIAVNDTIRRDGAVIDRETLRATQTPQGFDYAMLLDAHRRFAGENATDDGQIMQRAGHPVWLVDGEPGNRKITTQADWDWAVARVEQRMQTRVGQGYDVHRFVAHAEGAPAVIRLGGIDIPHPFRLEGHSDADCVLHAITDALLGAAGDGDIGQLFPPSDARWKGADSAIFLAEAVARVTQGGGRIGFLDVTVIAEAPKIGPHREAMRQRIAQIAGLDPRRINIKATTTETLGFTGRREGLAAMALATLEWPVA